MCYSCLKNCIFDVDFSLRVHMLETYPFQNNLSQLGIVGLRVWLAGAHI